MKKTIALLALFCLCFSALAETAPFVLALFDPIQYPKNTVDLSGLRLEVYGRVHDSNGVTIGLINRTDGETCGLQLGICNIMEGNVTGVVLGNVIYCKSDFTGAYAGIFGRVPGTMTGVSLNLVNANKHVIGCQVGLLNMSTDVRGLQFGLVNLTDNMYGVQIGLINFIKQGTIPVLPLVNAKF